MSDTDLKPSPDTTQSVAVAALALPVLPFAYIGIPIVMGLMAYSTACGTQAFLSLPAWVLILTAGALVAGTMSCILGRLRGGHHAPLTALLLLLVSGLVQANRAMLEPVIDHSTQHGNPLDHVADDLVSGLAIGLPWILALAVICISAAKAYEYVALLNARRAAV